MAGANYEYCLLCDQKALYVGDQDVPGGVIVLHQACYDKSVSNAHQAGYDEGLAVATARVTP